MPKRRKIEPITRREAAARRGCSPATATRFFRGKGAAAVLPDGSVDAAHSAFRRWLAAGPTTSAPRRAPSSAEVDRDAFLRLKLRKQEAEVRRLEARVEREAGLVIERDIVAKSVFGYLDTLNRRLLRDTSETVAKRVAAATRAGETIEVATRLVRDLISQQLAAAQAHIVTALRSPADAPRAQGADG